VLQGAGSGLAHTNQPADRRNSQPVPERGPARRVRSRS